MKDFYSSAEVADAFGVTRQTVNNWIVDENRFPNARLVGRSYVIPSSDFERVRKEEAAKLVEQLHRLGFQGLA